jgi:MFS family permease
MYALFLLLLINAINFYDRQVLGAVVEPIRKEWALSDTAIGWLGTAFTLLYAAVGVPLGRLADRFSRKRILSAGVFVWSLLTAASGMAGSFWQLFAMRLGVGVGEATCAPAATSLLGDLFPASQRGKVLSVFMLGLPVGISLSFLVTGYMTYHYSWRVAFLVAGLPGLICSVALLFLREPPRGAAESYTVGPRRPESSVYFRVLSIPTMWWLILSGALLNFNMYALGTFLVPFLMRVHGMSVLDAGHASMIVLGLSGVPGLLLGGMAADAARRRRIDGRLLLGALAALASVPFLFVALGLPAGQTAGFTLTMGLGAALIYVYYSSVYPTIQDVIEPPLRGTAMALYFFAMYVLGASLGPVVTGGLSDVLTRRAAWAHGIVAETPAALEPFRAAALRGAMTMIPLLSLLLAAVLYAASWTVAADAAKLER